MAAKKKTKKSAKASEETKEAQQPVRAPEQPEQSPRTPADDAPAESKPGPPGPPVAGIAASAGGLDAFKKFFAAMPADSGVAFVLIPHLDPKHESLMVELLARYTKMPVVEATDGVAALANHVFIIPPNKYMTISGGVLRLTGPVERGGAQTSIDLFLRSLANDKQEKAICIILSGTGSHGSLGLKAVKASDGMAMVQDPNTAEYPRMPQSAIATGLADHVLPVGQMPKALIKYVQHYYVNGGKSGVEGTGAPDHLNQVLALLRAHTKFDFRCYRKRMLTRRIERRMSLYHFNQIADYLASLREHHDEVKQLFRDLLISVTNFFRDPEAFQALETGVIAPLVRAKEPDAPLRVWSAGCATGEEPYSLGMLLLEQLAAEQKSCPLQIFATDVDEAALEVARQGTYPEIISADVSPERLGRYFTRVDDSLYQVSKRLREIVTFARQNLIADAPFSKLDLISCRNLLMYLEPEVQKKVIMLLHFSLNEGGFLFLGPSETIGQHIDLFEPFSKKWRIFRRIGVSRPERVEIPITAAVEPLVQSRRLTPPSTTRPVSFADMTHRLLLEQFAPAAALINRNYEILYFFGPTDRYLAIPAGEPTQDLMMMAREGLRTKLRSAIHKAVLESGPVTLADAQVKRNGGYHPVIVTIRPVQGPQGADRLLLVTFQDSDQDPVPPRPPETVAEESALRQLEYELKATKEDLQSTVDELEGSNEELKASNEEAMSMNEELQSANEELETSKEELHSLNEELTTVNNQLQDKVEELESANNDMANLLKCTEVAIIFLDTQFRIKRYTPPATQVFNLIATDVGRPISDITPKFPNSTLQQGIEQVLRTLSPQEMQVQTSDGRWWTQWITLYRTLDNRIEGVVLTFTDVTKVRRADEQQRRLATVLLDSNDAVSVHDFDGKITAWNRGAEQLLGYREAEALQMNVEQIVPAESRAEIRSCWEPVRRGERVNSWEARRRTKDGRILDVWVTATALKDETGRPVAIAKTERDITEQKRVQVALQKSQDQLAAVLHTAADAIITINAKGIIQSANAATERIFGYTAAEMIGQNVKILIPSPYQEEHDGYLANYAKTGVKKIIGIGREAMAQRKDGSTFPVDLAVSEVGHLKLFTGILRDITQRKELEREIVDIASLEQRRIGQNLHDSVGQELTALNLLAGDLAETLGTDPSSGSKLVERMAQGLQRSQQELRAVLRGLLPVAVDAGGLMAALSDLADRIQREGKATCKFDCPRPVSVEDNLTATHLYLIAQEAVHNAVTHAQPRSIRISLKSNHLLLLSLQDDGIGMPAQPTESHGGLGLRIMQNRAAIIGAALTIQPAQPTGTLITCALGRKNHETKPIQETSQDPDRR
jgi:two-component system, chemotaxis family, CheB/CheR fusion protein